MTYNIKLDGKVIATTELEKGDAPMGVATGKMIFNNVDNEFDYLCSLSKEYGFLVFDVDEKAKLLNMEVTDKIGVFKVDGTEIVGLGINIAGLGSDWFDISIVCIDYPFYEEEFPHIVKAYDEKFIE